MEEKDKFIPFFKIVLGKMASAARNGINFSPPTEATTFVFSSVFILLLWLQEWSVEVRVFINSFFIDLLLVVVSPLLLLYSSKELRYNI